MLAGYLPRLGFALTQVAVDGKGNELSAAPTVVTDLPLAGVLVSGDALFTQRALRAQNRAPGRDYV